MNTFLAASAAMLGWLLVEKLKDRPPDDARRGVGCGGRPRRHHALRRLRRRDGADLHRPRRRGDLLPRPRHQADVQVRRQPRRHRRPPRRRPRGLAAARAVRRQRHQLGGHGRGPVPRRRRRSLLGTRSWPRWSTLVYSFVGQLHHRHGDQADDGPAGHAGRRRTRASTSPSTPRRRTSTGAAGRGPAGTTGWRRGKRRQPVGRIARSDCLQRAHRGDDRASARSRSGPCSWRSAGPCPGRSCPSRSSRPAPCRSPRSRRP